VDMDHVLRADDPLRHLGDGGLELAQGRISAESGQALCALSATRPVAIRARLEPDVAPFPPYISLKPAKSFGMSLLKMDSEEGGIISQAIHQMFPNTGKKSEL